MPEYLAPGVYVEELAGGPRPIEGVSTSTAGSVGVTERGPLNVPQLVTSNGEFARTFGGTLPVAEFSDGDHAFYHLPYAVEGFFTNGGKRLWVTRVLPGEAGTAARDMMYADPAVLTSGQTVLLRAAQQGSGTAATPPLLYVLDPTDLSAGDQVRIGDGSRSDYRTIANIGAAATHVAIDAALRRGHAAGTAVQALAATPDLVTFALPADATFTLVDAVAAGTNELVLQGGDVATLSALLPAGSPAASWVLLQIDALAVADFIFITRTESESATSTRVWLARPLQTDVAAGTTAIVVGTAGGSASTLAVAGNVGDLLVFPLISPLPAAFTTVDNVVIFEAGTDAQEAASIGELATLPLALPLPQPVAAGTLGQLATLADDDRNVVAALPGDQVIQLDDVGHVAIGMSLQFTDGVLFADRFVDAIDTAASTVTLRTALPWTPVGAVVLSPKALTADAPAGAVSIALDDRLGLEVGDLLRLGTDELMVIRALPGERGPAPDAGALLLERPLADGHATGDTLRRQTQAIDPTRQATFVVLDAPAGSTGLLVSNGAAYAAGEALQLTLPDGNQVYLRIDGAATPAAPREIELTAAIGFSQSAGAPTVERQPLFSVQALDPGGWGNRLLVGARDEVTGLVANTEVVNANPPPGPGMFSSMQLTSITGVQPGTVLEMSNPDGSLVPGLLKVRRVDRATRLALLDAPGLAAAHMAAVGAAAMLGQRVRVRSREFTLFVMLRRRPDPSTPSRDDELLDQEVFRQVSMDPRHSRYIERLIGVTFTPGNDVDDNGEPVRLSDRRSEGASAYVRVRDLAAPPPSAARLAIRLGPEPLVDIAPSGLVRPARLALAGGDDQVPAMNDAMFVGVDSNEPTHRTGLQSLSNLLTVSLVAVPGQTGALLQQAVIDHCELMRYRFAVLDGPAPQADTLADVQNHRQQFDSSYAALYHPWPTIPDPYPESVAISRQLPVPPSGAVLGIYARSDNERGVHKAPANEVVRGITGLSRYFTKAEQDILNPYPVNINVIRDFRPQSRAMRVWGARCITSDGSLKYVNVRRLLIFIEASIEVGLQWVVFEPNAPPLWAALRRSVTDFLTTVWSDGALEGNTPEEGFFVKCDTTTMTRDDIDNGRLVCVIGVAPVKPAEYVIIRIGLWTADAQR